MCIDRIQYLYSRKEMKKSHKNVRLSLFCIIHIPGLQKVRYEVALLDMIYSLLFLRPSLLTRKMQLIEYSNREKIQFN